jgi:hypothetical protein
VLFAGALALSAALCAALWIPPNAKPLTRP